MSLHWDHPRLCGEKVSKVPLMLANIGSPPPMRGKVISTRIASVKVRITPAYAGKSLRACSHKLLPEDHPRLCGEKVPEMLQFSSVAGSPPPMRGKVFASKSKQDGFRITPAYAGKSAAMSGRYQVVTDHPRLCGEKTQTSQPDTFGQGSPPPMRGKDSLPQMSL